MTTDAPAPTGSVGVTAGAPIIAGGQVVPGLGSGGPAVNVRTETVTKVCVPVAEPGRTLQQLVVEAKSVDPTAMGRVAAAWQRVGEAFSGVRDALQANGEDLADAWQGPAAAAAQVQLQQAYASISALSASCATMAHATNYVADAATDFVARLTSLAASAPAVPSVVLDAADGTDRPGAAFDVAARAVQASDGQATQLYRDLSTAYAVTTYQAIPEEISIQFVGPGDEDRFPSPSTGGVSAGAVAGAAVGVVGGAARSAVGAGSVRGAVSASSPVSATRGVGLSDPYAAATRLTGSGQGGGIASPAGGLAGTNPVSAGVGRVGLESGGGLGTATIGGTGYGAAGSPGAGGAGAGRFGPDGTSVGPGASGMRVPVDGPAGAGAVPFPGGAFGAGSGPGRGVGSGSAAGSGAGRGAMAGVPLGGGISEGDREERERRTWLAEEEDVWRGGLDVGIVDVTDGIITG